MQTGMLPLRCSEDVRRKLTSAREKRDATQASHVAIPATAAMQNANISMQARIEPFHERILLPYSPISGDFKQS